MRPLPPWESALDAAARRCVALLQGRDLPDLSDTLILMPSLHAAPALRARIRALAGCSALIGPACHTVATIGGKTAAARRVATQRARLLLLDALRGHPGLTGGHDPWTLIEALAALFAELGDRGGSLPPDADALCARLRTAYGEAVPERPLRREAALVTTLWQAWVDLGGADAALGDGAAAVAALELWRSAGGGTVIAAGLDDVPPVLAEWLADHGDAVPEAATAPSDALHALAAAAVADADGRDPLAEQARRLRAAFPEPPGAAAFSVAPAAGLEHEARIVDVQIRQWWLAGHRRIALVTEDRKLARRVRALLARAGLLLDDSSGWALSTTSAAAALERWLEAVEEEFRASPLLDLMKSPFCRMHDDRETQLADAWQFEEGVVRREQVGRGLDRYRRAVASRRARLPDSWGEALAGRLGAMLDRVEHAAAPLLRHAHRPERRYPAADLMAALTESMARLGLAAGYAADPAGQRVLDELAGMAGAAGADAPALDWREWRTWLGRTLERAVFREPVGDGIRLLSLADCGVGEFDAVIVAGAGAEHMPGRLHPHPFFSDRVRGDLGLETWAHARAVRARQFHRALALAPRRAVTWCRELDQAEQAPSPWLAYMDALYLLAWGRPVPVPESAALAHDARTLVTDRGHPLPASSRQPAPVADGVPERWSARAHQDVIDCPYRWFAAHQLKLEAPEPLREHLSKQEFGQLVHACMQAFHADVPGRPGPFGRIVDESGRAEAESLLLRIGDSLLETGDFIARSWLRAWRRAVPALVDFEIARAAEGWRVDQVEQVFERRFGDAVLHGRIDRVERRGDERAVLDYKTGGAPPIAAIASGEDVQLTSYALGVDGVSEFRFVALADALKGHALKVAGLPSAKAAPEPVEPLVAATGARFAAVVDMIAAGAGLPAWGDAAACKYCRYAGLCRRGTWDDGDLG